MSEREAAGMCVPAASLFRPDNPGAVVRSASRQPTGVPFQ